MARTKRTKREVRTALASFSFINRSSYGMYEVDEENFHLERGPGQANAISVVHDGSSVTLYSLGEGGSPVTSIDFLVKDPARVLVQSHNDPKNVSSAFSTQVTLKDGDEITLVDNPQNPPLTEEEVDQIFRYIHRYREAYALQYSSEELWNSIGKTLGRTDTSSNDLESLYEHEPSQYNNFRRPVWFQLYDPLVPECPDGNTLHKMIQNKPFIIHAYWRALDREPGGNAAYLTIRYVFHMCPNKPHSVQVEVARNWDGENEIEGPFTPLAVLGPNDQSTLYSKIVALLLRQGDQINDTFHVVDKTTQDRGAYDTEWSSVELLVFTTEHLDLRKISSHLRQQAMEFLLCLKREHKVTLPLDLISRILSFLGPLRLIFRLHQQCIMGPQYWHTIPRIQNPVAANPAQIELINFMKDTVGMGRVNQVDWQSSGEIDVEGPDWRAKEDFQTTRHAQSIGSGYEFPIMFRWPS